jgi:hypothetical protein
LNTAHTKEEEEEEEEELRNIHQRRTGYVCVCVDMS